MLSIASMGGNGGYYLQLAREDYYTQGGEPLGRWWGRGAEEIVGLGHVANDDLRSLLQGFSPDGKALVQNAGKDARQSGWDLTFSAPKAVSVLWSQADETTRHEIQDALDEAVKAALKYLEDEVAFTRRGKAGCVQERAGLVVAMFEHGTSRELDPQLHCHALVLNVGLRDDLTTGSIISHKLYEAKMATGALFRAELASQLERRLGVCCEREETGTSFGILGIAKSLCDEFSKRRASIVEHLKSFGSESAAAAATATLETRRTKQETPPRSELFKKWREIGERFGFDFKAVLGKQQRAPDVQKQFRAALDGALTQLTSSHSHFTKLQLVRAVAEHAQDRNLSARTIIDHINKVLASGNDIVSLGTYKDKARFTTKSVLTVEKELINAADKLASNKSHGAKSWIVKNGLRLFGQHLTDEQREAVKALTARGGGLRSMEGMAGTGKTSTLLVVREILEKQGYRVYGATLSAKAAGELQEGAGITSRTIASVNLIMKKPDPIDVLKHEAKQVVRTAFGKPRYNQKKPFKFDQKSVLVIDEAAMVETKDLAKLAKAVAKAGGMVINVFDRKQLQAIGPGGAAAFLADRHGKAELTGIVRQHEEWMRETVKQFAKGDAAGALKQFSLKERIHVAEDRDKATAALVSDWAKNERGKRESSLIFVGTRKEVSDVNAQCQAARRNANELEKHAIKLNDNEQIHCNDRVLFTKNSRKIGVKNGLLGTVVGMFPHSRVVVVKLDTGNTIEVPLTAYKDVQLGYAVTTHKGQGTTVENAYLLAGGKMQDLHLSYVQASRARDTTRIYTDRHEAGDKLTLLAKQMSQEREKTLAHKIAQQVRSQQQQTATQTQTWSI